MKPIVLDLCCGLGGWTKGFLDEGYEAIGFDVERHDYGSGGYPGRLILKDIRTLNGYDLRSAGATVIVASPPCQEFSYRAMPWKKAKALPPPSLELFETCLRLAREADVSIIIENVKGAQKWLSPLVAKYPSAFGYRDAVPGSAKAHFGSYYLWGDVPALMPFVGGRSTKLPPGNCSAEKWSERPISRLKDALKNNGGSWFAVAHNTESGHSRNPVNGVKVPSASGRRTDVGNGARFTTRDCGIEGTKQGGEWFGKYNPNQHGRSTSSRGDSRKAASAAIAEIPIDLSRWIAQCFKP